MLKGLYKVEMETVDGSRRGVLYVYDGKMMGGNLAFAFIGHLPGIRGRGICRPLDAAPQRRSGASAVAQDRRSP
jgi:hypothetical protein